VIWVCLADTLASLHPSLALPAWCTAIIMQGLMVISRIYIGAHFPHQCLLGLGLGVLLVRPLYYSHSWTLYSRTQLVLVSLFLIFSSLGVYSLLLYTGLDPNWSITLARKHCQDPSWIYVDTTPFYALVRLGGSALGLALSLHHTPATLVEGGRGRRLATLLTTLAIGQASAALHRALPRTDLSTFYLAEFLLNSFTVVALVRAAQLLSRGRAKDP